MSDQKVSSLSEISSPTLDDILYYVDDPAGTPVSKNVSLARLLGYALRNTVNGRLTLASGYPVYAPQPNTPNSTDTAAEVCTFATAHGWNTGTIVTPAATASGLTTGTRYFIRALSTTTVAFYTTLADANADTNRVNLSGNVTALITPSGISSTTLYFSPYGGNWIAVYDGTRWKLYTLTELSLALGTLTSGKNYDVFVYDNSGTLTLELLVWTDDVTRATALTTQDGIWVKSGATTRRFLGTIRTDSTTTTIDDAGGIASQVGGKRFVSNVYNRVSADFGVFDGTATWTYSSATIRQANGVSGNKCEIVQAIGDEMVYAEVQQLVASSASDAAMAGIGLDSTTINSSTNGSGGSNVGATSSPISAQGVLRAVLMKRLSAGYHSLNWLEAANGSATITSYGANTGNRKSGFQGFLSV